MANHTKPDAKICFVHIERAGGTTLHTIFRNNYPFSYMPLSPRSIWANEDDHALTLNHAKKLFSLFPFVVGFGGHTVRPYIDYETAIGKPIQYITYMRNPIARYISHYNYHRNIKKIDWSLNDFLNEKRLHNFATKRLAGCFDLERAKEQLSQRFTFVGLTDRFDESLLLLRAELGIPKLNIFYEKQNASRVAHYEKDPELQSAETQLRIKEVNALDIELYEFVKKELYPQYVKRFGSSLDQEVAKFQEENRTYKFSKVRRMYWRAFRYLGYRNLEIVLNKYFTAKP